MGAGRRKDLRLGLYIVTMADPNRGRGHLDVARAALEGGADALQLRDKELGGREMHRLAVAMRELVEREASGCLFLVNDRVDVAIASGAHGVHLGQEDLPASQARPMVGEDMILGISATTPGEAVQAQEDGADYLGVGPVFATPSKLDAVPPIGEDGLREIVGVAEVPVVAIGGINEDNARQVLEAGADGIAAISAVTSAWDMLEAVRRLRRAVDACRSGR